MKNIGFLFIVLLFIISACYKEEAAPEIEPADDMDTCYLAPVVNNYVFSDGETIYYKNEFEEIDTFLVSIKDRTWEACWNYNYTYDRCKEGASYIEENREILIEQIGGYPCSTLWQYSNYWKEHADSCNFVFDIHHNSSLTQHYKQPHKSTYIQGMNGIIGQIIIVNGYNEDFAGVKTSPDISDTLINSRTYKDVYVFTSEHGDKIYYNFKYGIVRYESESGNLWELQL